MRGLIEDMAALGALGLFSSMVMVWADVLNRF